MLRILPILIFTLISSPAWADVLYVHSAKAPLFVSAAFNSERLALLPKGTAVEVLSEEKRWVNVRVDDREGWISSLLLKQEPPLDQVNLIGSDAVTLEGEARRRASAVATAGATRGLTDSGDAEGMTSDYQELSEMESLFIPVESLDAFSQGLGEE